MNHIRRVDVQPQRPGIGAPPALDLNRLCVGTALIGIGALYPFGNSDVERVAVSMGLNFCCSALDPLFQRVNTAARIALRSMQVGMLVTATSLLGSVIYRRIT